jgi:hypothetical protein
MILTTVADPYKTAQALRCAFLRRPPAVNNPHLPRVDALLGHFVDQQTRAVRSSSSTAVLSGTGGHECARTITVGPLCSLSTRRRVHQ